MYLEEVPVLGGRGPPSHLKMLPSKIETHFQFSEENWKWITIVAGTQGGPNNSGRPHCYVSCEEQMASTFLPSACFPSHFLAHWSLCTLPEHKKTTARSNYRSSSSRILVSPQWAARYFQEAHNQPSPVLPQQRNSPPCCCFRANGIRRHSAKYRGLV